VLVFGVILGTALVAWVRRRGGAEARVPQAAPLELRDLDGRLESLIAQLRELDLLAAKRTPEQLARERYALELEAARALMAREPLAREAGAAAAPAPAGAARGFLWGVGSTAAVAALVVFVFQSAEQRPEGGSVTGNTPAMGGAPAEAPAPDDPETAQLRAAVAQEPENLDARLALARQLLVRRDLMGVWNETQQVLQRNPGHPRALSYQALVRLAMGQGEMAVDMLKQAIAAEPDLLEAHQNLAFVYASLGRTKESEAEIAEVGRRSPAEAERLRQALAQVRSEPSGGGSEQNPHEGIATPGGEGSAENAVAPGGAGPGGMAAGGSAAAGSDSGKGVFGWIEADAGTAARVAPGTAVFITVRPAGMAQGPPVAVKRLESGAFPLQFELGAGDSMMGQPLPDSMRIDVRADSDGDPMTRPDTDPKGFADNVAVGRTGVRLTLK
jgi:tetratricopeptide (TPR) repeat protein